jgi:hypothetical protein
VGDSLVAISDEDKCHLSVVSFFCVLELAEKIDRHPACKFQTGKIEDHLSK